MEQEKAVRLLARQIKDIQAQADRILAGNNSDEAIESFAKYSMELKSYISTNIESDVIRSFLKELPDINYERTEIKLWQYLIVPSWLLSLYKDYHAKNETVQEISQSRGKYATLELLIRGLTN